VFHSVERGYGFSGKLSKNNEPMTKDKDVILNKKP